MSLKRQNIYFLLEDSKSLLSPSMLDISMLLIGWNSLSLLFLVKKNSSHFLWASCKHTTLHRKGERDGKSRTKTLPHALFTAAILFSQGSAVFICGCVHFLSSLFSLVLMLTHREIPLEMAALLIIKGHPGLKLCWYIPCPTPPWAAVLCSTIKAYMASSL